MRITQNAENTQKEHLSVMLFNGLFDRAKANMHLVRTLKRWGDDHLGGARRILGRVRFPHSPPYF